jgi:hypothetical protein
LVLGIGWWVALCSGFGAHRSERRHEPQAQRQRQRQHKRARRKRGALAKQGLAQCIGHHLRKKKIEKQIASLIL